MIIQQIISVCQFFWRRWIEMLDSFFDDTIRHSYGYSKEYQKHKDVQRYQHRLESHLNNKFFKRFIIKQIYQFFFLGPVFCAALELLSVDGLVLCGKTGDVCFLGGYFGGLCLNHDIF